MANEKELNPSPKFPVGEKPELSPNPNFSDGLENKTSDKANTQIVNESKVQPIKNLTVQQIIELIQKYAPRFDPSSVQAGELVSALGLNADGLLKKQALAGLFDGKYVRIMTIPESTTLTDEQIAQFVEGGFMNGVFLGLINPVFFPVVKDSYGSYICGFVFGKTPTGSSVLSAYWISGSKVIQLYTQNPIIELGPGNATGRIDVKLISNKIRYNSGDLEILNKKIPSYPSNTGTFTLKCVDGVLTWVADE